MLWSESEGGGYLKKEKKRKKKHQKIRLLPSILLETKNNYNDKTTVLNILHLLSYLILTSTL